jgi:hypothetical protein
MAQSETPFEDLLAGKRERLVIFVQPAATNLQTPRDEGLYVLTREQFQTIARGIVERRKTRLVVPELVARRCDLDGIGDPWFRLSPEVATWLAEAEMLPVEVDAFMTGPE